jgi:hypothetical protein
MCEFRVVLHYGGICDSVKINPAIFVVLYLFENKRLRKIFFLNIMTIIIVVKVVPLLLPGFLPTIIEYIFK